jgi:RNA polymerase sigma factor (sigma-70 family)
MTEQELIENCKLKIPKYQNILYEKYSEKILKVCLKYSKNFEDAQDATTETFIKVFMNIEKFSRKGSFDGWIKKIAKNTSIDKLNKTSNKKEVYLENFESLTFEYPTYDFLEFNEIINLIKRLPKGYKKILYLNVIEGFENKEIAKVLNIDEGTCRSQLFKCRKLLKKLMNHSNLT